MTPQTVNAYYHPTMNEIVFPAAILQPPFFDVDADDAVNYGGIGAVIGHEIGHGFDDQGSRYRRRRHGCTDWWTEEDRARFDALAQRLIEQFNEQEPADAPGSKVNGGLTIGENIGDLGGLTIGSQGATGSHREDGAQTDSAQESIDGLSARPALLHRVGAGLVRARHDRRRRCGCSPSTRTRPSTAGPTWPATCASTTRPSTSPRATVCGCRRTSGSGSSRPRPPSPPPR